MSVGGGMSTTRSGTPLGAVARRRFSILSLGGIAGVVGNGVGGGTGAGVGLGASAMISVEIFAAFIHAVLNASLAFLKG